MPIKIETGRFRSRPVEQRLCELCEMHKVENEIHFLCECPLYHDLRETLYDHAKLLTNDFVTMGMQEKICIFDEAYVERSLMLSCSIMEHTEG